MAGRDLTILPDRALNRATLARQHLLARTDGPALDEVAHLGGLQSQAPLAPYVGLWTRIEGLDPTELSDLTESRRVVRLPLMRITVHLVTAVDALAWAPLLAPVHRRGVESTFRRRLGQVDRVAVVDRARELLDAAPRTRAKLAAELGPSFPDAEPAALAELATRAIITCQIPPRGLWNGRGAATWAPLSDFLDAPPLSEQPGAVEDLVHRYLGAFGPATVADVQLWSGLTHLAPVLDQIENVRFHNERGTVLYDLPDAPRPGGEVPAPPRLLPEYDNLLLSHADRSRTITHGRKVPLPPGNGARQGTVLIDGCWEGLWALEDEVLRIETFVDLSRRDRRDLITEADDLVRFLGVTADIRVDGP